MKKAKRYTGIVLAVTAAFFLTACGGKEGAAAETTKAAASAGTAAEADAKESVPAELPEFEAPILLISAGQSADFDMVKVIMDQAGVAYSADNVAEAGSLGDNKTIIVAVGGSSKGLGAAGIDADAELDRVDQVMQEAKEKGLHVIALHIGGEGRRGALGDRYIEPVVSRADYVIVVESGNKDGIFTDLCTQYGIPLDSVDNMAKIPEMMKPLFEQ